MFRIDVATAAETLPAISTVPGPVPNGFWTNGAAGVSDGTVFDRDWFNTLQESLIGVLTSAGITPARGDTTLFLQALVKLFTPVTTITSSSGAFSNGRTVWPGGLIHQWGYIVADGLTQNDVIFPYSFPNNVYDYGAVSVNSTASNNGASVTGASRTGLQVNLNADYTCIWWAWGY